MVLLLAVATGLGLAVPALPPETGTQPGDLRDLPDSPEACSCHFDPQPGVVVEPGQTHATTAMALAARDPLFRAAFVVAKRDRPNLTQLCIRCHSPRAWLGGRGEGTLADLVQEDLSGINCDVCHRMTLEDPPLIGSAQLSISPSTAKRSARGGAPFSGHGVQRSNDLLSSEACGVCHSLFNPVEEAHDHLGRGLGFPYYEQRTYEEWVSSAFPARNQGCIDCHMQQVRGRAVDNGPVHEDLWTHDIVGANDFVAPAVHILEPTLGLGGLLASAERRIDAFVRTACSLELLAPAATTVAPGDSIEVKVRITNKTGHKLPTGYPEGRRVYLELALIRPDRAGPNVVVGVWDPETGDLVPDAQLVAYETVHGRVEGNGPGEPTHHLLLMNQVLVDTRIPPEGFMPPFEDMRPVGRDFGPVAPYRHFDEPTFMVTIPDFDGAVQTVTLRVRAMYQVAHAGSTDFLIRETAGTPEGADLERVWRALDRAPPREMARAEVELVVTARSAPLDAGAGSDLGPVPLGYAPAVRVSTGCRAHSGPASRRPPWGAMVLMSLVLWARTSRQR